MTVNTSLNQKKERRVSKDQRSKSDHSDKIYTCNQCPKSSKSKQSIINHRCLHIDSPFRCDICDKSFSLKSTLTNHIHSSKKHKSDPYKYSKKGCQYNMFSWSIISEHTRFGHTVYVHYM